MKKIMKKIAIEGLDGSGKTTVATNLKVLYEGEGLKAGLVSPYRLARKCRGSDLYPLWKNEIGAMSAVGTLRHVLETVNQHAEQDNLDVLIFDRHWMTAFTEIDDKPEVVKAWGDNFVPTALLSVDAQSARARSTNDQYELWMTPEGMITYEDKYAELARKYGDHILGVYRNDDGVSSDSIARSIMWDLNIVR